MIAPILMSVRTKKKVSVVHTYRREPIPHAVFALQIPGSNEYLLRTVAAVASSGVSYLLPIICDVNGLLGGAPVARYLAFQNARESARQLLIRTARMPVAYFRKRAQPGNPGLVLRIPTCAHIEHTKRSFCEDVPVFGD